MLSLFAFGACCLPDVVVCYCVCVCCCCGSRLLLLVAGVVAVLFAVDVVCSLLL